MVKLFILLVNCFALGLRLLTLNRSTLPRQRWRAWVIKQLTADRSELTLHRNVVLVSLSRHLWCVFFTVELVYSVTQQSLCDVKLTVLWCILYHIVWYPVICTHISSSYRWTRVFVQLKWAVRTGELGSYTGELSSSYRWTREFIQVNWAVRTGELGSSYRWTEQFIQVN